jgi:hypothetical protein
MFCVIDWHSKYFDDIYKGYSDFDTVYKNLSAEKI